MYKEKVIELLAVTPDEDLFTFYLMTPDAWKYLVENEMEKRLLKYPTKH